MTSRDIYGYGLISGLQYTQMKNLTPGFILDMFRAKGKFISSLFGGGKQKKKIDDSW